MTRYAFCSTDELDDGERILKTIANREIAVFQVGDEYFSVANYCVHAGGPVCEGALGGTTTADPDDPWTLGWDRENEILSCPWHGWEFDIASGRYLSDDQFVIPTYEVEVEGEQIYVVTGNEKSSDRETEPTETGERTAD